MPLSHRIATPDDAPALDAVMTAAIAELQRGFLDPAQIEASRAIMGLDRQLLADGTYLGGAPVPLVRMGKAIG